MQEVNKMKSTEKIAGQLPWRVGVSVITENPNALEYLDGIQVPQIKVSQGYMLAHGFDIGSARQRAERLVKTLYADKIMLVDFFNTEPLSRDDDKVYESLPGLTLK